MLDLIFLHKWQSITTENMNNFLLNIERVRKDHTIVDIIEEYHKNKDYPACLILSYAYTETIEDENASQTVIDILKEIYNRNIVPTTLLSHYIFTSLSSVIYTYIIRNRFACSPKDLSDDESYKSLALQMINNVDVFFPSDYINVQNALEDWIINLGHEFYPLRYQEIPLAIILKYMSSDTRSFFLIEHILTVIIKYKLDAKILRPWLIDTIQQCFKEQRTKQPLNLGIPFANIIIPNNFFTKLSTYLQTLSTYDTDLVAEIKSLLALYKLKM